MSLDECYITPNFVDNAQSGKKIKKKVATFATEIAETPASSDISSFFKKHKMVIIAFAIIIIMLIIVIVWIFASDKKISNTNEIVPLIPAIASTKVKPILKQTIVAPVVETQDDTREPEKVNIMSHDQIVNTVDDEELNKFIKPKNDTPATEQPKSNDEFDHLENYEVDVNKE